MGGPIAALVANRDYKNWDERMNPWPVEGEDAARSRFLAPATPTWSGMWKYKHDDLRTILERASARETAARVAAGALGRGPS